MIAALAALLAAAPPPLAIPTLVDRGAEAVQAQWQAVKELADPDEQVALLRRHRLERVRCTGLVELDALMRLTEAPLRLRDTIRYRLAARPEMVAVVAEALAILHQRRPEAVITVGDVAQPGCGQIRFGTIVQFVSGDEARALEQAATWQYGAPAVVEPVSPDDYIDEHPRFVDTLGPLWVERTLTGKASDGTLRVDVRRFDAGRTLGDGSVERLLERTRKRLAARKLVTRDFVWHTLDDGQAVRVARAVWRDPKDRRFVEVVWRPGVRGSPVRRLSLLRVREASLDPKKPTSLVAEERYDFLWDGEAGVRVDRRELLYEAQHVSHIAGFDADLSYVTAGNLGAFEPSSARLDPAGSWEWLRALDEAARRTGVPLKAMFVDRSIYRVLKTVGKKSDPAWKRIRISPGHDSHVHVRVGPAPRLAGRTVAEVLKLVGLPSGPSGQELTAPAHD